MPAEGRTNVPGSALLTHLPSPHTRDSDRKHGVTTMRLYERNAEIGGTAGPQVPIRARDVMVRDLVVLPAWLPAATLLGEPRRARHASYPVVDAAGAPVGMIDPAVLGAADVLGESTFGQICRPIGMMPVVGPDDDIARLLDDAGALNGSGALVVQSGRLVGAVSPGYLRRLGRARTGLAA